MAISGRNQKSLDDAAKELGPKAITVRSDVSRLRGWDTLFKPEARKLGHSDVLLRLYRRGGPDAPRAFLEGEAKGQLDLPMARRGGFAGGLFAIFVPSKPTGTNGETSSQDISRDS